jgi:hypothetical protein
VDAGDKEHDADADDRHPLQRAQRARVDVQTVLQPKRPPHQRRARQRTKQIRGPPPRQQDERERRDADRHHQDAPRRHRERARVADELDERFLREQHECNGQSGPWPRHFGIAHHRCDFSNA